jgi:DnaJ family protein A protein 5
VLYNKDDLKAEDYDMLAFGFNIWKYFSTNCYAGFEDDEGGFFAAYRTVFELIKAEEQRAFQRGEEQDHEFRKMCGFGNSATPLAEVDRFYTEWENFNSYKSFKWVD